MNIKSGGYQTGRSYQFYCEMGHNPTSAFFMRHSDKVLLYTIIGLGISIGILLGMAI